MAKKVTPQGAVSYATEMGGKWFNPLLGPQVIKGEFVRTFTTPSKFKNMREGSDVFGKKEKVNYEIVGEDGNNTVFGEGGGPLQALLDDLSIGDGVEIHFSHLEREDGEKCPTTVNTSEKLKKWRGGKKVRCFPKWTRLLRFPKKRKGKK